MGNKSGSSGLDNSGKTSYLNALADEGSIVMGSALPTVGHNICSVMYNNRPIRFIDVGGSEAERENWRTYFGEATAVRSECASSVTQVYLVDASDRVRLEESGIVLNILFHQSELSNCPFLVLANKQDLFMAMNSEEITDSFNLGGNLGRPVHVETCSTVSGENILHSLDWFSSLSSL